MGPNSSNMTFLFSQLSSICKGILHQLTKDRSVEDLIIDSRKSMLSENALFFAIAGERHDGHVYIPELYAKGIRQFVVEKPVDFASFPEGNFLVVPSSVHALQLLA